NNVQNFPVLTSATYSAGALNIIGTFNSATGGTYRIEFFGNDVLGPEDHGEGRYFLGSTNLTTTSGCDVGFNVTVPFVSGTKYLSATATHYATLMPTVLGDTSEFSRSIPAPPTPTPTATPTPTPTPTPCQAETASLVEQAHLGASE